MWQMRKMRKTRKIKIKPLLAFLAFWAGDTTALEPGPAQARVEIRGGPGNYQLYRDGEIYLIRGAGAQDVRDLESLRRHGGNSLRTWHTGDGELLDKAHELGLTVSLCLDMRRERHGFDYDDSEAVQRQFLKMREKVLRFRDHPALLTWIIGNELNHDFTNHRVYDAVNDVSKMIHELDPNHPTTTATAGINQSLAAIISQRAPDLDFLSVQVYGGLFGLKEVIEEIDFDKPIMVTEWGTVGHWEVPKTSWGAPIEMDSSRKASNYRRGYETVIAPLSGRLVGNYVFLWGQKQERTPTWYGMFTPDGLRTETVDTMQRIWTGAWPENRTPEIRELRLNDQAAGDNVTLKAGETYSAFASASDHENDNLAWRWQLMEESAATQQGGDPEEMPADLSRLIEDAAANPVRLQAPETPGAYRLFVYIADGEGGAAHGNIPFYVTPTGDI